jgi:hypothetical protein
VDAVFAGAGTGTSVGLNIGSGKKLKLVGDVIDTNGNELLKVTATASAVNELTLANAATGGVPTLTASGDDTNIGFELISKGTGEITANVNGKDVFNASSNFGFKNRIINGAMVIDQRNDGASVTQTTATLYVTDRFAIVGNVTSKFTSQQSSTVPAGFVKSLIATSSSAYTVGASEFFQISQRLEGNNIADLGWGTANAQTVTLSFWVRSSLTGTFGGSLYSYSGDVSYPFSYTISSANTWTTISVTIAGPTTGTFPTDNSGALVVNFSLGAGATVSGTAGSWSSTLYRSATGATSVVGTSGATFYITGVQLEKGSTATSFDVRSYPTELAMCQRYYYRIAAEGSSVVYMAQGQAESTTAAVGISFFPVSMRTAPSALEQTGTATDYRIRIDATNVTFSSVPTFGVATTYSASTNCTVASGLTAGKALSIRPNTSAVAYLGWSAEL